MPEPIFEYDDPSGPRFVIERAPSGRLRLTVEPQREGDGIKFELPVEEEARMVTSLGSPVYAELRDETAAHRSHAERMSGVCHAYMHVIADLRNRLQALSDPFSHRRARDRWSLSVRILGMRLNFGAKRTMACRTPSSGSPSASS